LTAESARLSLFSKVLPLVTRESLLFTNSLINCVGFGVVVIMTCGLSPNLNPNNN